MRTTLLLAVIVGCSVCMGPANSAPQERAKERVSFNFTGTPLPLALELLFQGSKARHSIDDNVPRVPITLKASDLPLETALRLVLWMGHAQIPGLTYEFDGQTYRIGIREPGEPFLRQSMVAKPDATEISLDVKNTPLRQVLALIFKNAETSYAVAGDVRDVPVTIKVQDLAVDRTVRIVARLANAQIGGLRVIREGPIYVFVLLPRVQKRGERGGPPTPPIPGADDPATLKKISLQATNAPLRDVLRLIFKGSGLKYAIEPNVPDVRISLTVKELSLRATLRLVVRLAATQAPGLTYARKDGVYVISLKR